MNINVNVIGSTHNANQDFVICNESYGIVADGCSECKYSEVGTRLTLQLFESLKEKADPEKFEENINKAFDSIIGMFKNNEINEENSNLPYELLRNNMLFTILAVFDTKEKYIVYALGDGYIITRNSFGKISYIHLDYKNQPPYLLYKYHKNSKMPHFQKFEFRKKFFLGVGVASDGIDAIAKESGGVGKAGTKEFEACISNIKQSDEEKRRVLKNFISILHSKDFPDDTSMVFFGGVK